jgi:hypothetical protein
MSKRRRGQVSITRKFGAQPIEVEPQPQEPYAPVVDNKDTYIQVDAQTSELVDKSSNEQVSKARITVYVPDDLANQLEEVRLRVKRLTGRKGYAVSRSALAEAALAMLIDDFEANQEYSYLAEWVTNAG